jgi:antitoxin component HigA of HigAB toxin-antitoxin module
MSEIERIHCIACEDDRRRALQTIERLRDADPESPEGHERDALLLMVAKWEQKGKPAYREPT